MIKCKACGNYFNGQGRKYCDLCTPYLKIKCKICGNFFIRHRSSIKKDNYCSRTCGLKSRYIGHEKIYNKCIICGKTFRVFPSDKDRRKFCSQECYWESLEGSIPWNKGKHPEYMQKSNHHSWKGGISKIIKVCLTCGKKFETSAYNTGNFCSYRCNAIYGHKHNVKKDTDIEIILDTAFKNNNIEVERNKNVLNITSVDFFVKPNICVYADGDYWHNLPGRKELDNNINNKLVYNGFKVFRFWGKEIKNNINYCISEVNNALTDAELEEIRYALSK